MKSVEGISAYDEARRILAKSSDGYFIGPRSEDLVQSAERFLGVEFPSSYRRFVLEFGAGDYDAEEIYGVVDGEFESGKPPNAIWVTWQLRQKWGLANWYVIIGSVGDGGWYALDCSRQGKECEGSVVILRPPGWQLSELVASSFGEYLLSIVS